MVTIDDIKNFAEPYYKNKDIMHDMLHIERVLKYVIKLVKEGNYIVNDSVILYSAYFHGFIYNSEHEIRNWLQEHGMEQLYIDKIIKVAWESQKDKDAETLEGKILHDAHMIEGGKTYLIVKSLITGSVRGQTLQRTIEYIENNIIDNGTCYLPEAIEIYKKQQEFAKAFIIDLREGI